MSIIATKHAVTALSKGMRQDLVDHGIRVTNISPGLAETEFSIVRFKGDEQKLKRCIVDLNRCIRKISETIFFAATRPPHMNLEEITILPTAQSDSRTVVRKGKVGQLAVGPDSYRDWQLSSWQLAVGSWQLAVGSWQLAVKIGDNNLAQLPHSKFFRVTYHIVQHTPNLPPLVSCNE